MAKSPITGGGWVAILAAALFGLTTPLVQHFGRHVGPFATASLLYAGAVLGSVRWRRTTQEPSPGIAQLPRLIAVALFGSVLAPAALAFGLQRTGALAGALLLNLEALFTVALAALIYREPLGARVALACALMVGGGSALAFRGGLAGTSTLLGLCALVLATLGWALDNTLTRPLADFDTSATVLRKALLGSALSALLAWALRDPFPAVQPALGLLACGATGYGLSLRLYLRAQRVLGAARTGSLFALAPFFGGAVAFAVGDRQGLPWIALAATLFGVAAYLHLTERHAHRHRHEALDHEHLHTHDDGHHDHVHDPPVLGSHAHPHHHEPVEHEHPHGSDVHHRHRHE